MNNRIGKNIKTLGANINIDIVDDVLQFHHKGSIMLENQFYHRIASHNLTLDELKTLEYSDYELIPFHDGSISCEVGGHCSVRRNRSASQFANIKIPFSNIQSLCVHTFKSSSDGNRPYPSGGALYPIEVICVIFSKKIENGPASGFYHYRPLLNVLQRIKEVKDDVLQNLLYRMESSNTRWPNFSFIYIAVLPKMLVKYRYRGYRYALIETGAMLQQADLVAQSLGMVNKIFSGFNDYELLQFIGLDKFSFIPLVIQSFGVTDENYT